MFCEFCRNFQEILNQSRQNLTTVILFFLKKGRLFMKISEPSTSHLLFHPALTIIKIMVIVYYVGRPHFQWQWFLPLILGFKACKMHWLPLLNLNSSIITSNVLISHTDIVIYFLNINILQYLFLSFSKTIQQQKICFLRLSLRLPLKVLDQHLKYRTNIKSLGLTLKFRVDMVIWVLEL